MQAARLGGIEASCRAQSSRKMSMISMRPLQTGVVSLLTEGNRRTLETSRRGASIMAVVHPSVLWAQPEMEWNEHDAIAHPVNGDGSVAVAIQEPKYRIQICMDCSTRVLNGAEKMWAHVGHSGWKDSQDMEMTRREGEVWVCEYKVPASRLKNFSHLELQLAFKGWMGDHERWDNNGGDNWTTAVELSMGRGLVTGPKLNAPRTVISILLLRIQQFMARRMLTQEQGAMLRTLAWSKDFELLRLYQHAHSNKYNDEAMLDSLKTRCSMLQRPGLHVVHIAAEMAPIAKVGGLADVVTSLAKAHQSTGAMVEVVLPKYDCIKYHDVLELTQLTTLQVPWGEEMVRTVVWSGITEGLPVYFIEPTSKHAFFWRGCFYGEPDDAARFLFFSRAALEFLLWTGQQPDVLHVHDWQSACVAPLLKEQYRAAGLNRTGVVLTIHNIAFQGWLSPDYLTIAGLDRDKLYQPDKLMDDSRPGFHPHQHDINLLRGGVVYADCVTTVSPTYAKEVFEPSFGMGLEGVLALHEHKFRGVLNGIDHETWDPATDPSLPAGFSADNLEGKMQCKMALLQEVGLSFQPKKHNPGGRPILAIVTRLTEQKGLPLIVHGIRSAILRGAQVILLGSAPNPEDHALFEQMAWEFGKGDDARLVLRYDDALSHRIYGGADMILIPSAFEPCGLTQLISLRYGTIPIVRETGGLADTVHDVAHSAILEQDRNGFTFQGSNEKSVEVAVGRAVDAYFNGWDWWRGTLVPRAMLQDWSWSRSAQDYLDLYHSLR